MNQLPLITDDGGNDNTPLPLIVANRWNFPLAHIQTDEGMFYAVQDWLRGVLVRDVAKLLSKLRRTNPQFNSLIKLLPYKTPNSKIYKMPYVDEDGLLWLLVNSRRNRGRERLVEIRNFIADYAPQYQYMRCSSVENKGLLEIEFQRNLVENLKLRMPDYEVYEFYQTSAGHVIDIIAVRKHADNVHYPTYVLIECKVKRDDFYKAVGQIICYDTEISGNSFSGDNRILAIAMPYEIIDDYMLNIVTTLPIRLISILDDIAIDAVTGEPFSL